MERVTQEDFVQEHKRTAYNWYVDRARSSQNTKYTFMFTKIKQSYIYNLSFIFIYKTLSIELIVVILKPKKLPICS